VTSPVQDAIVRVNSYGKAVVLFQNKGSQWNVWDSLNGKLKNISLPVSAVKNEIDMAFMNQKEAVLVYAESTGGISVKRLDGSDLPQPWR